MLGMDGCAATPNTCNDMCTSSIDSKIIITGDVLYEMKLLLKNFDMNID